MSADEEALFLSLPLSLQRQIEAAFDRTVNPKAARARKRRKVTPVDNGGGFVAEDAAPGGFIADDAPAPGGFVVDDEETAGGFVIDQDDEEADENAKGSYIPLSSIPGALQLLDLPPDDDEVLIVFRNAASGWGSGTTEEAEMVSRKDWRAVCAVLLEVRGADPPDDGMDVDEASRSDYAARNSDALDMESEDRESDEYAYDDQDESEAEYADDGEYLEGGQATRSKIKYRPADKRVKGKAAQSAAERPTRATRSTQKRRLSSSSLSSVSSSSSTSLRPLTGRQKRTCLDTFSLFFPDLEPDSAQLKQARIMIKDISRVAKLLKEKISAEEIVEMLETFSTAPDKSMGLSDFERMMVTAKMA